MPKLSFLRRADHSERSYVKEAISVLSEHFDVLFDHAPIAMHAVDKDFSIVKVNRRWLEMLGYKKNEVLGRKPTDFLTEDSRERVVNDALPLFWRAGSDRSVGAQFVGKDGQVRDVLIDAEVCPTTTCNLSAYAALYNGHDPIQWKQSSATLKGLREITGVQHELERVLFESLASEKGSEAPDIVSPTAERGAGDALAGGSAGEANGAFFEVAQDISGTLRGLLRIQDEWMGAAVEQQRELLLVTKSIEKDLAELTDVVATAHEESG